MKLLFLLPPSEGKNSWWNPGKADLSFDFVLPLDIASSATQKDLKCAGKRYQQGIELNQDLEKSMLLAAISRYSWVMYNAIDYERMWEWARKYFEENFLMLSGMYGLLRPRDIIGNYKLPIETKWLYKFWWDQISTSLNKLEADYIIDMLPGSYTKMVNWKLIDSQIIRINFLHNKGWELKKISHGVKKIKGEYIKNICEIGINNIEKLPGEKVQISENEYHINIIS